MVIRVIEKNSGGRRRAVMGGALLPFYIGWSDKSPSNKMMCHQREKYVRKRAMWLLRSMCSGRE